MGRESFPGTLPKADGTMRECPQQMTPGPVLPNYTEEMLSSFFDSVLSLVVRTSTDLPPDVRAAMKVAMAQEQDGTQSAQALTVIAQNIDMAADCEGAICQDTGMPTFEVK